MLSSKEALERLYDGYQNGMAGRSFYDIIEQELDRLEHLEKENQELRKIKEKAICEMQKAREKMDFYAQSEQYEGMYAYFNGVYKGLQEVIENES